MSSSPNPTLNLHLTPKCEDSGTIISLSANLTIGGLYGGLQGGRPFNLDEPICVFTHETGNNNVTSGASLRVEDSDGSVNVHVKVAGNSLEVFADRQVQGDVSIQFGIYPQTAKNENTNLHQENGGLVGSGSFLPRPYALGTYNITITSDMPEGIRVVTSLGEGTISTIGTETTLQQCIFMVGNVHSFPKEPVPGSPPAFCGTYWLSELPPPLEPLKDFCSLMFPHLSKFFNDENGSYRTFVAKSSFGIRGTPFPRSTLIEYDEDTKSESDWELVRLLNKSMIQSWAQLDPEDDGTLNNWFSEGLSNLYTIYLPFRFKQRTPDYFRATLNGNLTSSFTNPLISVPLNEIPPSSSTWHVESLLPSRACIYMIRMDCFTRRASVTRNAGIERPIDEIVAEICVRRRRGEKVQQKDWLKYIGDWIGNNEAVAHLDDMKSGKVLDLEDMKTAFGGIDAVEGRVMQMGFDKESLGTGIVSGVVKGSNACEAGLRDRDEIVCHSRLRDCEANCENKFTMTVKRNGEGMDIEYLPRGDTVVKMWRSIKK